MSKRLQVLLNETEFDELREAARRRGVPVSDWVRDALRNAHRREQGGDVDSKVRTIRAAARHEFPTADIDEMLAEIERGHAVQLPE